MRKEMRLQASNAVLTFALTVMPGVALAQSDGTAPTVSAPVASTGVSQSDAKQDSATVTPLVSAEQQLQNQAGDIVVTAQKRSESINKVGISITAVTGDALQQQGVASTADLVKVVPGFNFTPSAYGTPVLTLRGIGFYDTALGAAPTVSTYVDEVPLPLAAMAVGASLDLERVEVLKGPQGTLFGQNATGGAINYIAAAPTSAFRAGGDLTYASFDRVEGSGFVSGPITDTLGARVAVKAERSGDWQYSYTRSERRGQRNFLTGRVLLDWHPIDKLTFRLNANAWRDRSDNQASQLVAVVTTTAFPALRNYPLPPRNNRAADWDPGLDLGRDSRFWQVSLRADYELSDYATITSITAYEQLRRRSVVDADGTAIENYGLTTPGRSNDFSQELRISGDVGRLRYVLGGNYAYDHVYDEADPFARDSSYPFDAARATNDQHVNTYAVFGNLDYKIADTITLQGGARYTDQNRRFAGCTYDSGAGDFSAVVSRIATQRSGQQVIIAPGACVTLGADFLPRVVTSELDENNVSWRAGVNWQATPTALLYANVSKGYKSGAYPTAGATFAIQLNPATQESVLAYEAGFKVGLFDRRLQLNGAAFYYDYTDKQFRGRLVDPIIGPQNALINVPKSRVAGAEIQATLRPLSGLNVNVGATYVGTRILGNFTNYNALAQRQRLSGESFPLTPAWQVTADANYEFPVSNRLKAILGGTATYQGKTNGGLGDVALFRIDPYALLDARIGVGTIDGRWRLTAFARNLTDKFYSSLINQSGPDAVIRYTGMPRTFGLTLSFRD